MLHRYSTNVRFIMTIDWALNVSRRRPGERAVNSHLARSAPHRAHRPRLWRDRLCLVGDHADLLQGAEGGAGGFAVGGAGRTSGTSGTSGTAAGGIISLEDT